jgi:hypothetical protein
MKNASANPRAWTLAPKDHEVLNSISLKVRALLSGSLAFNALSVEQQIALERNLGQIVRYLAAPEGIPGNYLAALLIQPMSQRLASAGNERGDSRTILESIRNDTVTDSSLLASLLRDVDFPEFVSGLIKGVFQAIVDSSIQQMEAYGKLLAEAANSVDRFVHESTNTEDDRARLVEHFPEIFMISCEHSGLPRFLLCAGVDEREALRKLNELMQGDACNSLDLDDSDTIAFLLGTVRTKRAIERQKHVATTISSPT